MKLKIIGVLLLSAKAVLAAQGPSPPPTLGLNQHQQLDQLRHLADLAKDSGDLPRQTLYLCQAAALDPKKFAKKCDRAKGDTDKALAQYQMDLEMGRGEVQRKDYSGALRDLGKITFGPNKAEAQQWMQQARIGLAGGDPVDPASLDAYNAARAAYERGDFDAVGPQVARIHAPVILAAANQLITNIYAYREAMKQADAMFHKGELKGAEEKYQIAAAIRRNGPGRPQDRVREVQAAEAQAAAQQQPVASVSTPPSDGSTQPPLKPKYHARNKSVGSAAHKDGPGGDVKDVSRGGNASAGSDVPQADATAGKTPSAKETPQSSGKEDTLIEGIADFYASRFANADDAIGEYLKGDKGEHTGAAHFYLGASLLVQALLTSAKDQPQADALRQKAQNQFVLARQLHYQPIESTVSPKILAQWTQTGDQ